MSAQHTSSRPSGGGTSVAFAVLPARGSCRALLSLALAAVLVLTASTAALAAPRWRVNSLSNPTAMVGEQTDFLVVISNDGDRPAPETPAGDATNCSGGGVPANCYRMLATFPAELTPTSVNSNGPTCAIDGGANAVRCQRSGHQRSHQIEPGRPSQTTITITATVNGGVGRTLTSAFEVTGAGAGVDTTADATVVTTDPPEFGVAAFDGQVTATEAGDPLTQAGGHPFAASTAFELNAITDPNPLVGFLWPPESMKTLRVDLPPGFVGDPTVADRCTTAELANADSLSVRSLCPATSQVGTALVRAANFTTSLFGPLPVYNMVPPPGVTARFGFNVSGTIVSLDAELRSESDYGLTILARNTPQGIAIQGTEVTFWGVPSADAHDHQRACSGVDQPSSGGPTCESGAPDKRFLRNPTMCTPDGVGLPTRLQVNSWENPGVLREASFESHLPPAYPSPPQDWGRPQGPTDCDRVPFDPSLTGEPGAGSQAGKPAGFAFDLSLPQSDSPTSIGTSDLRKAVVTLPQGVRVNPSSAQGLAGCSSAQIGLDNREMPSCPEASRIGSLTIDTPLLREPLEGGVYLATPFDNPFNSLIAIYLVAEGPGLVVKLPGHISPDASRGGQLTATFDDQPQLPFSRLHLEFKGGPRAPIVLPKQCGTHTTRSVMTGWSGRTVTSNSSFTISEGCGNRFAPGFSAGTTNPVAGDSTSFVLRMTRDDIDQELQSVSVDMPPGVTGRIADAVLCGEAQAAAGTCGGGSLLGNVTVGAGAGTNPFYITNGRVHITGPYKGAPFGLSIVVPAVAGPFDLGTVVVRSALFVDKHTAEIRVVSDPLPTQLQGIPLDVKDVRVTIDRDGFMLNPTNCEEMQVGGRINSTLGSSVAVSSRFQVGDCAALPLEPRMRLVVGGRRRTQRGRSTPLRATLRQTEGQSALSKVRVTLPTAINARLTVINDACTREEYESASDACEFARTGSAVAVTPLLRDPLRGGVYFVRNGNPLPDLFVRLRGQVDFDLVGKITIPGSKRLRTTFDLVPDVPISMFALRLEAGRDGSIGNAANLCSRRGRRARAALAFIGQNGKRLFERKRLKVRGCSSRAAGKRARRGGRR